MKQNHVLVSFAFLRYRKTGTNVRKPVYESPLFSFIVKEKGGDITNLSRNVAAYVSIMMAYQGLNEDEVARLAGVSRTTVSNLLQDKGNLELKTVETIAANLGIDPVALLCYPQDEKMLKLLLGLPEMLEMLLALSRDKRLQAAEVLNGLAQLWNEHMPE